MRNRGREPVTLPSLADNLSMAVVQLCENGRPACPLMLFGGFGDRAPYSPQELPPGDALSLRVSVREWLPVMFPGRYRVAICLRLPGQEPYHHVTLLVVSKDDDSVRRKIAEIEAALLKGADEESSDLREELGHDYDPRYTAETYVRLLEHDARTGDEWGGEECLRRILDGLAEGWFRDPAQTVARLAAIAWMDDTQLSIHTMLKRALDGMGIDDKFRADVCPALQKHFDIELHEPSGEPEPELWTFTYLPRNIPLPAQAEQYASLPLEVVTVLAAAGLLCGLAAGIFVGKRRAIKSRAHTIAALGCLLSCGSLRAGDAPGPITLTTPEQLEAIEGFPISIPLKFRNQGPQEAEIPLSDRELCVLVEKAEGRRTGQSRLPAYKMEFYDLGAQEESVTVPPRGAAEHSVDLRRWVQVVQAGRYRVTVVARLGEDEVVQRAFPLTVSADPDKLQREIQDIEARLLDPHGDFLFLWLRLTRLDPRYTVDTFLRVLESLRTCPDRDYPFMPECCLERIRAALELGWARDPEGVIARLAALARRADTQQWIASGIRREARGIALPLSGRDPRLVSALQEHFGVSPRDFDPSWVTDEPVLDQLTIEPPRPRPWLPMGAGVFCAAAAIGYLGGWLIARARGSRG